MMSMSDAVRGTLELMEAPSADVQVRTSYNLHGFDITPAELTAAIRRHVPDFEVVYAPDHRQAIAESWPNRLDDHSARRDWGWQPEHDVVGLVQHVLEGLAQPIYG